MSITEASYPISFRKNDVQILGEHLNRSNSVNIIGMKRVGINNFLRFFLNHPQIQMAHLSSEINHLFIHIDLHDLVEREIFPFWILTLKRLVDVISGFQEHDKLKEESKKLFTESIQLKDLFFTVDSVRKVISLLVEESYYPTLIFNRFDRMQDAATQEFFNNLQSLKDHAERNLSFIFTSYRPLYELKPEVFTKQALSVFSKDMYLTPMNRDDASTILATFEQRYNLPIPQDIRDEFLSVTGGHVQYMHLSMLKLREAGTFPKTRLELIELLLNNEEAILQSEELLDSLTEKERQMLTAIATEDKTSSILADVPYLTNTGMIIMREGKPVVFTPLLRQAILRRNGNKTNGNADFTKKEHALFSYLEYHTGELCEREAIIEAVWPDYSESGVSDWAIDRLVARVRSKLKAQNSPYEITTVITRGYKLVKKS